jgi:hypothetical protein
MSNGRTVDYFGCRLSGVACTTFPKLGQLSPRDGNDADLGVSMLRVESMLLSFDLIIPSPKEIVELASSPARIILDYPVSQETRLRRMYGDNIKITKRS